LTLKAYEEELMILYADRNNATVVFSTADYNQKVAALLQDQAYRNLKKDPTKFMEIRSLLLLKRSANNVNQNVRIL
jgi:hypothetical protein